MGRRFDFSSLRIALLLYNYLADSCCTVSLQTNRTAKSHTWCLYVGDSQHAMFSPLTTDSPWSPSVEHVYSHVHYRCRILSDDIENIAIVRSTRH
jgi:hypothetical protein